MRVWYSELERSLELGASDASIFPYISDVVTWFGRINNDRDAFSQSLIEKYGEHDFRQRFEEFVDRVLVADTSGIELFPVSMDAELAKKRYRQLIRIFHPDRGAKDEAWLNYRAEKINSEYERYCNPPVSHAPLASASARDARFEVNGNGSSQPNGKKRAQSKVKFRYKPSVWRSRLGDANTLQKKMIFLLSGFSLLLVLIVYASSRDVPIRDDKYAVQDVEDSKAANEPSEEFSESAQRVLDEADWLTESDDDSVVVAGKDSSGDFELGLSSDIAPSSVIIVSDERLVMQSEIDVSELPSHSAAPLADRPFGRRSEAQELSVSADGIHRKKNDVREGSDKNAALIACPQSFDSVEVESGEPMYITVSHINLRSSPSVRCDAVDVLPPNTRVKKLKCLRSGSWCFVEPNVVGEAELLQGWLRNEFLSVDILSEPVETVKLSDISESPMPREVLYEAQPVIQFQDNNPLIDDLIAKYKVYFENGNASGLSGLYLSSARENKMRGVKAIGRYYRRAFKFTKGRSIDFSINDIKKEGGNSAILNGVMRVGKTMQSSGKSDVTEMDFRLVMLKSEKQYKIAVFDYLYE